MTSSPGPTPKGRERDEEPARPGVQRQRVGDARPLRDGLLEAADLGREGAVVRSVAAEPAALDDLGDLGQLLRTDEIDPWSRHATHPRSAVRPGLPSRATDCATVATGVSRVNRMQANRRGAARIVQSAQLPQVGARDVSDALDKRLGARVCGSRETASTTSPEAYHMTEEQDAADQTDSPEVVMTAARRPRRRSPRLRDGPPLVEMRDIYVAFGGVHAVEDVTIDLYPGEIVGLVGGNGAGKSTLMRVLSGAHPADSGQIFVDGRPANIATSRRRSTPGYRDDLPDAGAGRQPACAGQRLPGPRAHDSHGRAATTRRWRLRPVRSWEGSTPTSRTSSSQ